jgi:hypothetical protein
LVALADPGRSISDAAGSEESVQGASVDGVEESIGPQIAKSDDRRRSIC